MFGPRPDGVEMRWIGSLPRYLGHHLVRGTGSGSSRAALLDGRVTSSVDNTMMESFWSTMQRELLDHRRWTTKAELGSAIFEWIEAFYNPIRRHTGIGGHSPATLEALHTAAENAA